MRVYGESRRELFEATRATGARARCRPTRFEYAEWRKARVNIDYHVRVDGHYYSVPYALVHEEVEARLDGGRVEILHGGARVASHRRVVERGRLTTKTEHMPSAHRAHAGVDAVAHPELGRQASARRRASCASAILAERPHPEQGYRSCLGILRLGKRYGDVRLEAACARALRVARALVPARRVDPQERPRPRRRRPTSPATQLSLTHENVRGRDYYH